MDKELCQQGIQREEESKQLRKTIWNCDKAIQYIGRGGHIIIATSGCEIDTDNCELDDGQQSLIETLLTSVIKSRMETAEDELRMLLNGNNKE